MFYPLIKDVSIHAACGLRTPGSVCVHGLTVEIVHNLKIPGHVV